MLAPTDRKLLLDVLAPPVGYHLDEALGTTYTLDLLALLRVPLAATALPWADRSGGPVTNPFALLTALRRNASRVSLFCHAGATVLPRRHIPLLTYLEDAVIPVTAPRAGAVFHPKVWLLRFRPQDDDDPVTYRLLVLSRNLTFDRSWDTALVLDGELVAGEQPANRTLSDFVAALPAMAAAANAVMTTVARRRVELLADEVRRVEWSLPEGFDELAFHPLGHAAGIESPITDLRRLMVVSPFVSSIALKRLRAVARDELLVAGRFDELVKLDGATLELLDGVEVFDDPGAVLDVGDEPSTAESEPDAPELAGLHAKIFLGERGKRAVVWIGSANATDAAFDRNVEFLVELGGSRKQHGIDTVLAALRAANLIKPFIPAGQPAPEDPGDTMSRALERAAHDLAQSLRAQVTAAGEGRWRPALFTTRAIALEELRVQARPLAETAWQPLDLAASPCREFAPTGLASISAFFALRITGTTASGEQSLEVTVRLPMDGAPDGRAQAVTAELLEDSERLMRFILVLLADDGDADRMLSELEDLLAPSADGTPRPAATDAPLVQPLLEPLLRALHRNPERLDEVDDLLRDIREAGGDAERLVPAELQALLASIAELRTAKR